MKFYAFDSFEGMPKSKGIDSVDNIYQFVEGQYACTEEHFKDSIEKNDVNLNKVELVPGWFEDTLTEKTKDKLKIKKASVIWVDCDLYASTVPVLEFITQYLQNGTIICFDDWFSFLGNPNRGEQKAFYEWIKKYSHIKCIDYHTFGKWGKSFIVSLS
ncbi:MAG: Methyltransferase [uncultured Campylobacterales bacterium]|uniref:Methyltransferase n=1 Tax=uncultured Campylobacterales bacterium TaxID=352960 RepID=A0A6S6TM44_9BACT|nr:MAG: Methyltransferase [uncultured Campylobacterales bacterium]